MHRSRGIGEELGTKMRGIGASFMRAGELFHCPCCWVAIPSFLTRRRFGFEPVDRRAGLETEAALPHAARPSFPHG